MCQFFDNFNRISTNYTYSGMSYRSKPPTNIYKETYGADGVYRTHVVRHCSKFSTKTEVEERVLKIRT